jgi:hypothetical protein
MKIFYPTFYVSLYTPLITINFFFFFFLVDYKVEHKKWNRKFSFSYCNIKFEGKKQKRRLILNTKEQNRYFTWIDFHNYLDLKNLHHKWSLCDQG